MKIESDYWYYLHTNGDLICKRTDPGEDQSDFVKRVWKCDPTDRTNCWNILVEALALGARHDRVLSLAAKWCCNACDLVQYVVRIQLTPERKRCVDAFILSILNIEPDAWWDWLAATPKGDEPNYKTMPTENTHAARP